MTLDDELRRRLQHAADRAGEGADPGALATAVASTVSSGVGAPAPRRWRLFGLLGFAGLVVGGVLGVTLLRPSDERVAPSPVSDALDPGVSTSTAASAPATSTTAPATPTPSSTAPATTSTSAAPTSTAPPVTVPVTVSPTAPPTAPPTVPPTAPPTAPPDTQAPTVQAGTGTATIYDASWAAYCPSVAVVTATATDNVGVTAVTGTWSGLPGSPRAFTKGVGTTWTMQFGPFNGLDPNVDQGVAITVTARDAAGNTRATVVNVQVVGTCLI